MPIATVLSVLSNRVPVLALLAALAAVVLKAMQEGAIELRIYRFEW
ncbi:hypothetical protein [Bacillus cereus]|nr:hypothetical protein [Bacillus cereus]KLA35386.1 hypothetical protein B4080_3299 [Bacillus cereus]